MHNSLVEEFHVCIVILDDSPCIMHTCNTALTVVRQNPVGAGRYDVQRFEEAQHKNGHSSLFKSKSYRPDHTKQSFMQ